MVLDVSQTFRLFSYNDLSSFVAHFTISLLNSLILVSSSSFSIPLLFAAEDSAATS